LALIAGGETVLPTHMSAAHGGGGSTTHSTTINLHFHGPTNDTQVVEALKRHVRFNGPLDIRVKQ